ncbi:MAG: GNAT family N-acetyltransferase [Clostridia bacterium]|nr:GNAT family N-acetyltransferase [Clostridia bacterium]
MKIVRIDEESAGSVAPLVADFRVTLLSLKGIRSEPDREAAKEELRDFLSAGYPVFAAEEDGIPVGYIVCRIDGSCLWVEHLFVKSEYRRKGAASLLFGRAEELAHAMGEETVFNFVHPTNEAMIAFLRSKGYTVLNMIEIRKPYKDEVLRTTVDVNGIEFDY